VVARRVTYYQRDLSELDPDYDDCPIPCHEADEDRPDYCETCPSGYVYRALREDSEEEITKKCPPESRSWSFENLFADVAAAMNANARLTEQEYPEGCSALEARAIDAVRGARMKARRIDQWNAEQERKRINR
jgi:hypothetical protein